MKTLLTTVAIVAAMSTAAVANPFVAAADRCEVGNGLVDYSCIVFEMVELDTNARQEGRGSAFSEVAEAIAEHNPNDANRFKNEGGAFIDALYGYIWQLRGQLGLD